MNDLHLQEIQIKRKFNYPNVVRTFHLRDLFPRVFCPPLLNVYTQIRGCKMEGYLLSDGNFSSYSSETSKYITFKTGRQWIESIEGKPFHGSSLSYIYVNGTGYSLHYYKQLFYSTYYPWPCLILTCSQLANGFHTNCLKRDLSIRCCSTHQNLGLSPSLKRNTCYACQGLNYSSSPPRFIKGICQTCLESQHLLYSSRPDSLVRPELGLLRAFVGKCSYRDIVDPPLVNLDLDEPDSLPPSKKQKLTDMDLLSSLPKDILLYLFTFLPCRDCQTLRCLSSFFNLLITSCPKRSDSQMTPHLTIHGKEKEYCKMTLIMNNSRLLTLLEPSFYIWNLSTGQLLFRLPTRVRTEYTIQGSPVYVLFPNTQRLATVSSTGSHIYIWDLTNGTRFNVLATQSYIYYMEALDDTHLILGSFLKTRYPTPTMYMITIWNIDTGKCIKNLTDMTFSLKPPVYLTAFANLDNFMIMAFSNTLVITQKDLENQNTAYTRKLEVPLYVDKITHIQIFKQDKKKAVLLSYKTCKKTYNVTYYFQIWDFTTNTLIFEQTLTPYSTTEQPTVFCLLDNEKGCLLPHENKIILVLFNENYITPIPSFKGLNHAHKSNVYDIKLLPQPNVAISASKDCSLKIWNLLTKTCCRTLYDNGPLSNILVWKKDNCSYIIGGKKAYGRDTNSEQKRSTEWTIWKLDEQYSCKTHYNIK